MVFGISLVIIIIHSSDLSRESGKLPLILSIQLIFTTNTKLSEFFSSRAGTLHPGHLTVNNGDQRWPPNGRPGTVNANYISVIRGQLLSILSPKVHSPWKDQVNIRIPFPICLSFVSLCQVINQSVSNIISEPPPPPAMVT